MPLLDLRRQYQQIRKEVLAALERVCESQQFILGAEVEALEAEIAGLVGCGAAVACASGTDALWLALVATGVGRGDEVLTTPFSFFATAGAIVQAGARPIFCDIDPATFNLDAEKVRARLEQMPSIRLKALLPAHLYGQCADVDTLGALAAEFNLALIEDAAQAFGGTWRGRRAGSFGAAATFSFYPTKNLGGYGDGGCVTAADPALAGQLRLLREHGSRRRYHHEELGWNSRLDALQAAVLRVKMRHVEEWNRQRRERAAEYDRLLRTAGLAGAGSPVRAPEVRPEAGHVFHQYVVRAERRDGLAGFLAERGVATQVYYPLPLHLQPALGYLGHRPGDCPEAERAAAEVLALPMFPELRSDEQQYVVEQMAEFYS